MAPNTRSRKGAHNNTSPTSSPPVTQEYILATQIQQTSATPPTPVTLEHILATHKLMQTMVQYMQNQLAVAPPFPSMDKRGEFMREHPPTFSHASNPLEADDWLRVVERQLNIVQCNDHEKVLYGSGQLQGAALDWWESFQHGHQDANQIGWEEFKAAFRSYHVPASLVAIKKDEFLNLKQGSMSVLEYRDKFTQLSRYALGEVDNDAKKQKHFLKGLNDELQLQLLTVVYANFEILVDRAIVIEHKRREMEEKKRRMQRQTTGRNTRPRYIPLQEFQHQELSGQGHLNQP